MIGVTMAYYNLTFNVIGATMESPSQNPLACLYKPRAWGDRAEPLRRRPCGVWLSLAPWGAGLADSRLTSPRDPSALLREASLPLSFWGAPPTNYTSFWKIIEEISLGCSLEGMMLELKFQYFGHLMWRVDSLEKTLMLGGIEGRRQRGWQRMRWLDGITDNGREFKWTLGVGDGQGGLVCCDSWGCKESDTTEQLNWSKPREKDKYCMISLIPRI